MITKNIVLMNRKYKRSMQRFIRLIYEPINIKIVQEVLLILEFNVNRF